MAFGPSEIPAQRSWMPLRVRFRTDSAMTPEGLVHSGGRNKLRKRDFGVNGRISARSALGEGIFCPGVLREA
jgi:hypothetical protein